MTIMVMWSAGCGDARRLTPDIVHIGQVGSHKPRRTAGIGDWRDGVGATPRVTAGKAPSPKERSAAAKARLLAAAYELFYAEGIQAVGIDRVIEHAGVAKATL